MRAEKSWFDRSCSGTRASSTLRRWSATMRRARFSWTWPTSTCEIPRCCRSP